MTEHNYNDSIEACAAHYGDKAEAVKTYMQKGLSKKRKILSKSHKRLENLKYNLKSKMLFFLE